MGYSRYGWCGSCGCNSCDCSCGRKTVLQQSYPSCSSSSSGTKFCTEPLSYLTSNLIVLAAGTAMEIKVADSSKLYAGQGIQIGTYYFQVLEIIDSTTVSITFKDTATPGGNLTAINALYGCYQYPIYYVGIVELDYTPEEIIGVDSAFAEVADSVVDPEITYFTYGYLGPNKIQFNLEFVCEIANTPDFIEIELPNADTIPVAAFSAILDVAGVPSPLVAYKRGTTLIVGPGAGTPFTDAPSNTILVSGEYGL